MAARGCVVGRRRSVGYAPHPAMPPSNETSSLRRLVWFAVGAQLLLVAAGLRHHLVWGESERWPWLLPLRWVPPPSMHRRWAWAA